jgi:hypothetical protein
LVALGGELGPVTPPGRVARSFYQAPAQRRAEMRIAGQMGHMAPLFSLTLHPASIGARQPLGRLGVRARLVEPSRACVPGGARLGL